MLSRSHKKKVITVGRLILIFLFVVCIFQLYAQAPSHVPYRHTFLPRGDRQEGFTRRLASSPKLALLSAIIVHNENISARDVSAFKLKFYLNEKSKVFVTVRGYDKDYKMVPAKEEWSPSETLFSWPTKTVMKHHKIHLKDLGAVASIGDTSWRKIAPIALFVNSLPEEVQRYEFVFVSNDPITIKFKWVRDDIKGENNEGSIMKEGSFKNGAYRPFPLIWDCKDLEGNSVDDGPYRLVMRISHLNGRPVLPYPLHIQFTHKQTFQNE